MDKKIKKIIQQEETDVPEVVKQRISQTLHNLPTKKKSRVLSFPFKFLISGAACILITIGAITYTLSNETASPSNQSTDNKDVVIHDYMYTGESEHWEASLDFFGKGVFFEKVKGRTSYESESKQVFRMEYKGDFAEVEGKPLSYYYKTTAGGGGGTLDEMYAKTVTDSSEAGNGAMMSENEEVEVTVEWAGKIESFLLKPNSSKLTNWEVAPTFPTPEIPTFSGEKSYLLRGVKGKAVYIVNGEIKAGKPYKTRWFFYGEDLNVDKSQTSKLVAVQKDTGQKETIHHSASGEKSSSQYTDIKEALKAQSSQHVVMTFPTPGLWRIDAYIDEKYMTSIVVEVKK